MQPLGILLKLKTQLEELCKWTDRVRHDFGAMKEAQRDYTRREMQRTDQQIGQEAERKAKIKHTRSRATQPSPYRPGRPFVMRSVSFQHHATENKAAMREHQRIENLLFTESVE
jgi:hypothetical protein